MGAPEGGVRGFSKKVLRRCTSWFINGVNSVIKGFGRTAYKLWGKNKEWGYTMTSKDVQTMRAAVKEWFDGDVQNMRANMNDKTLTGLTAAHKFRKDPEGREGVKGP